ncbi:glycosyltransferase family protein [Prevotella koreensis]|uniref:Uncharacterized protein n=1 Tax=Prevotella koreensis TaxID=2490854 RepID=A0A3S0PDM3_9BACT|nr:glycosyltransferase family 39 protein [Prevotella koreensis]RUL60254.1 hypothetical protein EHV08_11195 [Prevotella koreensis]
MEFNGRRTTKQINGMTETDNTFPYQKRNENGRLAFAVYLAVATIFLFITSFQGISHFDIGMYISGYQHFNSDPYTTCFLGRWYLTFHLLGAICNLFGIDTLLGLRLLRIVMLLVLQTIIYLYLRKLIKTKHIIAGLAITMFAQYGAYSEINYNDLSVFMLVCAILLYHKGLHSDNRPLVSIILSGVVVGISFFFRLVNLSFILLPFFTIIISLFYGIKVAWLKHTVAFFLGVAVGCLIVVGIAWVDGTAGVLQITVSDLIHISGDSSDPHNMRSIIRYYLEDILGEIKMSLFIAFVMYGFILANLQVGKRLLHVAYCILAAAIIIVVWQDGISANTTVGFCLAALLLDIFSRKSFSTHPSFLNPQRSSLNVQRSTLIALSFFIPLILPIGSNGTSQFYGQCLCILALPLAVSIIARGEKKPSFRTGTTAVRYIIVSICIGLTVTNIFRPMMEDGNRIECRYTIDSKATRFLLTNKENADLNNKMVKEVKPIIPSGSHLICNFSITMISVLECKPYGIFSEIFSTNRTAERYLRIAHEKGIEGKQLPYLLVDEDQETDDFRHVRKILSSMSPYEEVWRSDNYVLLKPMKGNGD